MEATGGYWFSVWSSIRLGGALSGVKMEVQIMLARNSLSRTSIMEKVFNQARPVVQEYSPASFWEESINEIADFPDL